MPGRTTRLDWAERWFGDGFRVLAPPGGFGATDLDLTGAATLVDRLRARGIRATFNHVIVRAAALALSRHPELHVLPAGARRLHPDRVDIGLSVAGRTSFAPVLVLEDAGRKRLPELCAEIVRRVPEVARKEEQDLAWLRRWGWLLPLSILRRLLLRWLTGRLWFRRRLAGTFQVSCNARLDVQVPFLFYSAACLGVGRVRDAVVPVGGQPAVRRVCTVACAVDHTAWDGMRVATFHAELRAILEGDELAGEVE